MITWIKTIIKSLAWCAILILVPESAVEIKTKNKLLKVCKCCYLLIIICNILYCFLIFILFLLFRNQPCLNHKKPRAVAKTTLWERSLLNIFTSYPLKRTECTSKVIETLDAEFKLMGLNIKLLFFAKSKRRKLKSWKVLIVIRMKYKTFLLSW